MEHKWKKCVLKLAVILVFGLVILYEPALDVNAATKAGKDTTDTTVITAKFDDLKDIVTAIISSFGLIITLWGISEWGMAFQGQDGMMQAHAFKRIAGGLVMILAPQILALLT